MPCLRSSNYQWGCSSCENNISAHYVGDLELGFPNCGVDAQDDSCDWVAVAQEAGNQICFSWHSWKSN